MKKSFERFESTQLLIDLAFGDALYGSSSELDADLDRAARRNRWLRRKGSKAA